MLLPNLRVVLVETSHPGNIGAAARAMKNMGATELVLVAPERYPDPAASARAAGADDVLTAARVVATLPEALAGCAYAYGASARPRHIVAEVMDARAAATRIAPALTAGETCALVFGRERTGLTNAEMAYCTQFVHIPAHPEFSSLNVAAAVQVLCYEVRVALLALQVSGEAPAPFDRLAAHDDMEQFYAHLEQVLIEIGFHDPQRPRHLMRRLRRLFARAALEQNELAILRGVLSAVQGGKQMRRTDAQLTQVSGEVPNS